MSTLFEISFILLLILIPIIAILIIIVRIKSGIEEKRYRNYVKNTISQHNNNYIEPKQEEKYSYQTTEQYPYHKKYLLTKNEYYFYKRMTDITNPLGLQILTKIRLADLIEVNSGLSNSEHGTYFNKIKSKHVDFAIAYNMKVLLIIELDDSSHSANKTIERDNFVNNALIKSGYTVVRTKGDTEIVRTALVDKGYSANLYTNTNYYN